MKKIMIVAVMLLCMAVCMVPVFAEEAELPSVPPEEAPLPEGEAPSPSPEATPLPGGEADESEPDGGVDEPSVEDGKEDWIEEFRVFVNERVIPVAAIVILAVGTLYAMTAPVFEKVKKFLAKFNKASDDIAATAGESQKTKEQTKATLDKLRGDYEQLHKDYDLMCARYETMAQSVSTDMTAMKQELSDKTARVVELSGKMEKMMVVAFCNNRELVEKGYARRIAQIGAGVEVDMSDIMGAEEAPAVAGDGDEGEEADDEQGGIEKAS